MAGWYFSVNGRAEGPVSADVLLDGLKSGRFTLVDLVFREGSAGWTTLGEIPEFRGAFDALPVPQTSSFEFNVGEESKTDAIIDDRAGDEVTNTNHSLATDKIFFSEKSEPPPTGNEKAFEKPIEKVADKYDLPVRPVSVGKIPPAPAWIVLKRSGIGFEQVGPYTEEQILDRIGRGEIEYSMYAWKPGYKRWVRIGNLPEFDRRKRDRENDPVNQVVPLPKMDQFSNQPSTSELAKAIEVQRRPEPVKAEAPPPTETNGVDLTVINRPTQVMPMSFKLDTAAPAAPSAGPPPREEDPVRVYPGNAAENTVSVSPDDASEEVVVAEETTSRRLSVAKSGMPFWQRAAVALVAAGFVVVAVLAAAQWWTQQKAKEQAARNDEIANEAEGKSAPVQPRAQKQEEEAPSVDDVARAEAPPAAAAPQPAPPAPEQKKPSGTQSKLASELGLRPIPPSASGVSVLEIVPMKLSSTSPLLVFQTDAAVGETIDVNIHAKAGDILKWVSYSNNYLVRRGNGEIASLDLSKFGLPRGTYKVEATVGSITKTASIFIGVRDEEFETLRREHVKNVSQVRQAEKKALFYSAQRLEKLTTELGEQSKKLKGAKWKNYYAEWRRKMKDGARPAMNYAKTDRPEMLAYPEIFNDFAEAVDELNSQSKQLDQSVTQKRAIATVPLPVARSFKKLRIDASKLSSGL